MYNVRMKKSTYNTSQYHIKKKKKIKMNKYFTIYVQVFISQKFRINVTKLKFVHYIEILN